jgi:hypothetical protein
MELEAIRPVISGLIGGAISVWLLGRLAKSVPDTGGIKGADELVRENKTKILVSNILFFATLVGGVALYHFGYFERNDWRGLLLVFGIATVAPVLFLFFSSVAGGAQRVKEAYVAYAVAQRVPLGVLYAGFALGSVCLFVALGSVIGA